MKFFIAMIKTLLLKKYVTGLIQILVRNTDFADF